MGIYKWNDILHRIDIRFVPYKSWYSAILYFTGSKELNKKMRMIAKSMGYILNEYGLFNKKKMIEIKSEKDIFTILNMEYIDVKNR